MSLVRSETFSEGPEDDSLAKEVVVSDADLIKSGAMTKQGGIRKNWKKRFFKLSIVQLAYYTTDAKQKFKGGIPLEMVTEIRAANKAEMGGKPHGLLLGTEKRAFKFVTDSDTVRDEWVLAIDAAVKTARLGGGAKKAPARPSAPPSRPPGPAARVAAAKAKGEPTEKKVDEYGDGGSIYVNAENPDEGAVIEDVVEAHRRSVRDEDGKASFFVRATFDYEASDAEEISFKKNDILQVLDASHDEWWLARTGTAEGHVPSNRVAPIKVDSGDSAVYEAVAAQRTGMAVCTVAHTAAGEDELTLAVGDEVQLINKVGDDKFKGRVVGTNTLPLLFPVSCVEVKTPIPTDDKYVDLTQVKREKAGSGGGNVVGAVVTCIQDFEVEQDDELAMVTGDRVVITDIIDAEWVKGRLEKDGADGKVGMFPLSFVKSSPRMVKCVQDFEAEHEDELSLKVGDMVEVLEEIDADWLRGRVGEEGNTTTGIFPIAFVTSADTDAATPAAEAPAAAAEPAKEEAAAEAPAGGDAPTEEAPKEEAKEEAAPAEAPAEEAAAPEAVAPKEEAPAEEAPKEEAPKEEAAAEETPKEEAPAAEAAPAEETPKEEAAAEAPKEEAPKEEAPKEEAPAEEAPKEEAAAPEAAPAEPTAAEAPATEAPKEEAPKEEAPKEEAKEEPPKEETKEEAPAAEAPKEEPKEEAPQAEAKEEAAAPAAASPKKKAPPPVAQKSFKKKPPVVAPKKTPPAVAPKST